MPFYPGPGIPITQKGIPLGVATLGVDGKVPAAQIPTAVSGGLAFQGVYDAATNSPDLTNPTFQVDGHLYVVSVEGTQDIGNGSELFTAGDSVFYSAVETQWYKLESTVLAIEVIYDNAGTNIVGINVQDAIDELHDKLYVKPIAPSTTIFINPISGNDGNTGFAGSAIASLDRMQEVLKSYNWNNQAVRAQINEPSITISSDYSIGGQDITGAVSFELECNDNLIINDRLIFRNWNINVTLEEAIINETVQALNFTVLTVASCTINDLPQQVFNLSNGQQFTLNNNNSIPALITIGSDFISANTVDKIVVNAFAELSNVDCAPGASTRSFVSAFDVREIRYQGTPVAIADGRAVNFNNPGNEPFANFFGSTIITGPDTSIIGDKVRIDGIEYVNSTSGLSANTFQGAVDELVVRYGQPLLVNEETITVNKTLVETDNVYQHIKSETASLEVALPSTPVNGTKFVIVNDSTSTQSIDITGGPSTATLAAGAVHKVVYSGSVWLVI